MWSQPNKVYALAGSMIQVYDQVCEAFHCSISNETLRFVCVLVLYGKCLCVFQVRQKFSVDDFSHYLFTPRDLTRWVLGLLRYDMSESAKDKSRFEIIHFH